MQKTLLVCTLLALTLGARLDYQSDDCGVFLRKFGTANNPDGTGASKIAFTGDAAFVGTTADVKVNLRYSDVDYFNDAKFYGLVQQDGKTPETTCLDMKLYKFAASDYSGGVEVTDLTITPSNNFNKQWRYYSFTIAGADLAKRMIETKNSENFVYKGYYAIAYYAAGTDQLQYTFYFDFTVTVNRATGAAVDTAFKPLSYQATLGCTTGQPCNIKSETSLQWCTDFTCTAFSTPDLHLNDQFVLLQKITTQGMGGYYLTGSEVWYTGNGLNKKAIIKQSENTTPGQAKFLLNAEIAWRAVTIKVTSVLSTNAAGTRRLLAQTTYDTVTGQTDEITCIKAEGSDVCSTCQQECDANGFASDGCDSCSGSSGQILYAFLALLLVFAF